MDDLIIDLIRYIDDSIRKQNEQILPIKKSLEELIEAKQPSNEGRLLSVQVSSIRNTIQVFKHQNDNSKQKVSELEDKFNQKLAACTSLVENSENFEEAEKSNQWSQLKKQSNSDFKNNRQATTSNTKNNFTGTSVFDKIKITNTIQTKHSERINSICILKDKRLVSCSSDRSIAVYNYSYEPQIQILNAHSGYVYTLCVSRNRVLISGSSDKMIKIWRVNQNDYELVHTLQGHTDEVYKVIELEDGRLCSCSSDATIKVWDSSTYQPITTITGHTGAVVGIIEMNDYIISVSDYINDGLRIWNKSTYNSVKIIQLVYCCWFNGFEKLNNNTVLVGGNNIIFVVDFESSKVNQIQDEKLRDALCFRVIRNDVVLVGCTLGNICYYNPLSNQIISKFSLHAEDIYCLIEAEDNKIISCSEDKTIKIFEPIIVSISK